MAEPDAAREALAEPAADALAEVELCWLALALMLALEDGLLLVETEALSWSDAVADSDGDSDREIDELPEEDSDVDSKTEADVKTVIVTLGDTLGVTDAEPANEPVLLGVARVWYKQLTDHDTRFLKGDCG